MFKWFTKKKVEYLPADSKQMLEGVKLYYVRWKARDGEYAANVYTTMEAFLNREDAKSFVDSLKAAFKLTRNDEEHNISISEN